MIPFLVIPRYRQHNLIVIPGLLALFAGRTRNLLLSYLRKADSGFIADETGDAPE